RHEDVHPPPALPEGRGRPPPPRHARENGRAVAAPPGPPPCPRREDDPSPPRPRGHHRLRHRPRRVAHHAGHGPRRPRGRGPPPAPHGRLVRRPRRARRPRDVHA